jgi:predicted nucleic acid-binding protein
MRADGLLDTNIFIDVSRNYAPAMQWLRAHRLRLAVSAITRMELVAGARNQAEQAGIIRSLQPYQLLYPDAVAIQWALTQFETFWLSHQIEFLDCVIGATGVHFDLPIYTRNAKHLRLLPDVQMIVPY